MTLPDLDEHEEEQNILNPSVVEALLKVIQQAVEQGRISCGVQNCIDLMNSSPEKVMLCLLAQNLPGQTQDAMVTIEQVLIRALCHECGIDLLHVQDQVKLTQVIMMAENQLKTSHNVIKAPMEENSAGYSCVMIQYPIKEDFTNDDEDRVSEYIKHQYLDKTQPYIALPA